MNKEQLLAMGLTEEQADAILSKYEDSVTGLKSKKDELLDKLAKTKQSKESSDSEIERLRQLEAKVMQDEAEAEKNYREALDIATQREAKRANELQAQLEQANASMRKLVVDNGLDAELDKAQVNPALKAAAKAMLSPKLTVQDGRAVTEEGQSITDLVAGWTQTDEGKAFILAQQNSGGGGRGSNGQGGNAAGKKFSEMTRTELGKLYNEDPAEYRRLRDEFKRNSK